MPANKTQGRAPVRRNEDIRCPEVRLIDHDGHQIGIVPTAEARSMAEANSMDLVEISPEATPPVAKIMNWSKIQFAEEKERRAARSRQRTTNVTKEVQMRPEIDEHDLLVKSQAASRFLSKGLRVRVVVTLHGRFIDRPEMATTLLERFVTATAQALGHQNSDIQDGPEVRAGRRVSQGLRPVHATAHS